MKKNKTLQQKYSTYEANVNRYHNLYPHSPALQLPTFADVKAFSVDDNFWNIGSLTHPNEPWAVDIATQNGIRAYRTVQSCEEELRRIAREVRKMMRSSLATEKKLQSLLVMTDMRA